MQCLKQKEQASSEYIIFCVAANYKEKRSRLFSLFT